MSVQHFCPIHGYETCYLGEHSHGHACNTVSGLAVGMDWKLRVREISVAAR